MLNEINVSLFGNKLRIKKINIASDISLAQKFNVISVPTIIIGNIRMSVIIDKNELTDAILQGFISSVSFEEEEMGFDRDEKLKTKNIEHVKTENCGNVKTESMEEIGVKSEENKLKTEDNAINSLNLQAKEEPNY